MSKSWYNREGYRDLIATIGVIASVSFTGLYVYYLTKVQPTATPATITTPQTSSQYSPTASGSPLY